ncbi:hypothetical protein B0T14DRAFT_505498 [Immersiella caudata]|uniref:C2H2-type domain-containing protein n=1 Tax=Immersiella caudata TaxID=314043 RepID=A0AA39XFG5_9PEZI|nr:hypothetical protein B0T14DRAFT_505498 [Immersiella caudata]
MDPFRSPPADSLAAARLHVQALTECGLPREALLRALLENYGPSDASNGMIPMIKPPGSPIDVAPSRDTNAMTLDTASFAQDNQQQQQQQQQPQQTHPQQLQQPPQMHRPQHQHAPVAAYNARLSVSTTSSRSSGRASVLSTSTSLSSVSTQSAPDMAPFPPPPPPTQQRHRQQQLQQAAQSQQQQIQQPQSSASSTKSSNRGTSKPQGAYWCTFCDVAFQRKFDWKRHEDEFHERYKRYPCPDCNRIFWGANTFNQHHKNAHGCTTCPHADRVVQYTQRKQAWACGFCGGFLASRDRYFDHVARHYEDGCNKLHWNHSLVIYGLLHQPYITNAWKELYPSLYGHLPRDQQPVLEWDVELTGHAQGFLEGESPGKLQDLLEFFNESTDDPRFLANLALSSANVRPRAAAPAPISELPAAPVSRRVSEPPKQAAIKSAAATAASSKHMSAPQPASGLATQYGTQSLLKQRSMASLSSTFPSARMMHAQPEPQLQQQQHQEHHRQQQPPQQHPHMSLDQQKQHQLHNNPFMSAFPQTIMETPEPDHSFFVANQMQAHHAQLSQHHQHHQHPVHHPQLTVPTIAENLFEDWSSLSTTVVDEATFSIESWDTNMDLSSPPP